MADTKAEATKTAAVEVPRKSYAVIADEVMGQTVGDMSGLHPTGKFQCVLSEIFHFFREYKDTKTKQMSQDFAYIFQFTTIEPKTGVRRYIKTKPMTGKPGSSKSAMGQLLGPWFDNALPDNFMVSSLADRNGIMTITHEQNALKTSTFAVISVIAPLQEDHEGKTLFPLAYTGEDYLPNSILMKFGEDYTRIEDPRLPGSGKEVWFRAYKEQDGDAQPPQAETPQGNGRNRPTVKPSY